MARCAELAGGAGFAGAYNVDLIFGAAGETVADWASSLGKVLALDPPPAHVSAYALTVEPGHAAGRRAQPVTPDEDDQADKYTLADEALVAAGLEWYEISNWAKPGAECGHNLLYWSQGEYLGVGCAAHSHAVLPDGSGAALVERTHAGALLPAWWRPAEAPRRLARRSAAASGTGRRLVLSLRTRGGVPAGALPGELYERRAGRAEHRAAPAGRCSLAGAGCSPTRSRSG